MIFIVMSKNLQKEELLRSTINGILKEYMDGGGDFGSYDGYGVSEDFFQDLWNAFVDPLKHTAAFIENFSSEVQRVAGKLAEDVMASFLPGYQADYEEYEKEYQERMNAITDKYSKVFARTEAHLFTGDAALMAFLHAPHAYITGRIMRDSPDVALSLIDMLAGSNPSVKQATDRARQATKRFQHFGRMRGGPTSPSPMAIDVGTKKPIAQPKVKHFKWWNPRSEKQGKDFSKRFYKKTHTESVEAKEILDESLKDWIGKLTGMFQKPEIEKAIEQSPLVQQMQADAEKMAKEYVDGVISMTRQSIADLKSTPALDKATGGKFSKLIQKRGKEDAQKTAKLVVAGTKKSIKDIAVEKMSEKIKQMPKSAGELRKIYQQGISQIKSL